MSSVDDRIVNMQFNNKQFTAGATESQKALEGLDKTLANTGKSGGLTTMGSAVDQVSTKFSAMQVAGVAALGTIVSKATSAGLSMLKSFTIDPILQGFSEYQTNLNSIQTVVANTGESVDVVNGYMEKLNQYSDQTIYNFSEMAKNIGTFTAAGVDLKTATSAIQGIANLAALSGSNSQQASTAMYQLSQAIAAGKVGLMDWNSVVNAGMGGKVFQTALAQTAIGMGEVSSKAVDLGSKMEKLTINGESFRTSISASAGGESWLTSEVLTTTLKNLDGRLAVASYEALGFKDSLGEVEKQQQKLIDQGFTKKQVEGMTDVAERAYEAATVVKSLPQLLQVVKESIGSIWANSFSIIMGDFDQSKKLWSRIGKEIVGPTGFITEISGKWLGLLRGFEEGGGRFKVLAGLKRIFGTLMGVMNPLKNAFRDIFPPSSENVLLKIVEGINSFTKGMWLTGETSVKLRSIFGGLFSILHIGFEIFKGVGALIGNLFKAITAGSGSAAGGILSIVASIAEVITGFDKWLTSGGKITDFMGGLGTTIGNFIQPVLEGIGLVTQGLASLFTGDAISSANGAFGSLQTIVEAFSSSTTNGMTTLKAVFGDLKNPIDGLSATFDTLKTKMDNLLSSGGGVEGIFSSLGSAAGSVAGEGAEIAGYIVSGLVSGIRTAAPIAWDAIKALASGLITAFKSTLGIASPAKEMLPVGTDTVLGVAEGIKTGTQKVFDAIAAVGTMLINFVKGVSGDIKNVFQTLFGGMDALDLVALMNALFSAVLIKKLSDFTTDISGIFGSLNETLTQFQQGIKAQALRDIALAVGVLVASLVVLSLMDPKEVGQGLGFIAAMMTLLVGALASLSKISKGGVSLTLLATAMTLISAAMINLAIAMVIMGAVPFDVLTQGLFGLAASLGIILLAMLGFSNIKGSIEGMAGSLFIIALAMQALAVAVLAFGSMNPAALEQGLEGMAWGIGILVAAMLGLDQIKGSVEGIGATILLVAVAMVALAGAVAMLGKMDPDKLSQGLKGMAWALGMVVLALAVLAPMSTQVLVVSQAIALMSAAMIGLAIAIGIMGTMDSGALTQGLIGLAAGLLILLGAAFLAQYVTVGLAALGGVAIALGAGLALAGLGMLLFSTGLAILVALGVAGIAIMVAAIGAFIAMLPSIAVQVAAAFIAFLEVIANASPRIGEAFTKIFDSMLDVVIRAIPKIGQLLQQLLDTGLGILRKSIPQWLDMGMEIITRFLEGMMERIPRIADAALEMINELLTTIDENLGPIIEKGTKIIVTLLEGLGKAAAEITDAAGQALLDILSGIDAAVVKYAQPIRDKGFAIIGHLIDGMTGGLAGRIKDAIGDIIGNIDIGGMLPDIDIPGVGRSKVGSDSARQKKMTIYQRAVQAIAEAYLLINRNADSSANPKTIKAARLRQGVADRQAAEAALAEKEARKAEREARKPKASKAEKELAKKLRNEADKQGRQAQTAQNKADAAIRAMQASAEFNDADLGGKGDLKNEQADAMAGRATQMLQKANAEAERAKELMKTNRAAGQAMLKQAQKDAKEARKLAAEARKAAARAQKYYAEEVRARIEEIKAEADAKAKQKAWDDKYEAVDNAGKVVMLQKKAADEQRLANKARADAAKFMADAKRLAAKNPVLAMEALDKAEEKAAEAEEAAAAAQAALDQAAGLMNQPGTGTGTDGGGSVSPSRSVLEDAAKAVDRYTESLQEATELVGATQTVVQYNQTVNSPTQLDAATVYRQSKNLVSASTINVP